MTSNADYYEDELLVLGRMAPAERAAKLAELEIDSPPSRTGPIAKAWPFSGAPKPFEHTAHAIGYLAPGGGSSPLPLVAAGAVQAEPALRGKALRIALDRLRIAEYPGRGIHRVLLNFYAENHRGNAREELSFANTFRAQQGESAAIVNYPIFTGLRPGPGGLAFRCSTINVANEEDDKLLALLEGDAFNLGLELLETAQPAIKPLSQIVIGLTKTLAKRHRNVPVQAFYLGLDFGKSPTGARLREGTYFAVQTPEALLGSCWQSWAFDRASEQLVERSTGAPVPFNYVAFSVSRCEAP